MAICVNCKKEKSKLVMLTCEECIEQINKDRFKNFDFNKEFVAIFSGPAKKRFEILDLRGY